MRNEASASGTISNGRKRGAYSEAVTGKRRPPMSTSKRCPRKKSPPSGNRRGAIGSADALSPVDEVRAPSCNVRSFQLN